MTDARHPALQAREPSVSSTGCKGGRGTVLHGINLEIGRGEAYGLVGESGCGKSTAAYAVAALSAAQRRGERRAHPDRRPGPAGARRRRELRELRRKSVAMVYQDPGRALNPSIRIGRQVEEVFELAGVPRPDWPGASAEILARVRISDPGTRHGALSASALGRHAAAGGDRHGAGQRSGAPRPRRADHRTRCHRRGRGARPDRPAAPRILDLDPVHQPQSRRSSPRCATGSACSMPGGSSSRGATRRLFRDPRHPYTVGLLRCLPQRGRRKDVAPLATIPGFLPTAGARDRGLRLCRPLRACR